MLMGALVAKESVADGPNPPSCEDVLAACDLYVKDLEVERGELLITIENQEKAIAELEGQVEPTPWYFYALPAIAAGFLVNELIQ